MNDKPKIPPVTIQGRPLNAAPAYLRPYLDSVDGAMLLYFTAVGHQLKATWELHRGGEAVGQVCAEVPEGQPVW